MPDIITKLREQRAADKGKLDELLAVTDRALTPEEETEAAGLIETIRKTDERTSELAEQEARAAKLEQSLAGREVREEHTPRVTVGAEPVTYRKNGPNSYFRDLYNSQYKQDREATQRLARNDAEVRAINTTDGSGGYLVPPLWIVNEFVPLARAGRVTANLIGSEQLPAGTDSINIPKITTGTTTAEMTTQNAAINNQDIVDTSITAAVTTIAGVQTASIQLVEQSPISIDTVILKDLAADYALRLDTFVLNNNAANKRGILNVSGINAVTYTDASPALVGASKLWGKLANAQSAIATGRYLPPQVWVVNPRRYFWMLSQQDSQNRPVIVDSSMAFNPAGVAQDQAIAEGYSGGRLQGLPLYLDANMPTNVGGSQDPIVAFRPDDCLLYESTPQAEVFRATKADTGGVLFRFYAYVAFTAERFPLSISSITGTGLTTPTWT